MQVALPPSPVLSNGVLIEPGAQWYEGGNVAIFLLFHNLFLLVLSHRSHVLFGMCKYDYVSLLLIVHPFVYPLMSPTLFSITTGRDYSMLSLLSHLSWTLPPLLGSLVPST